MLLHSTLPLFFSFSFDVVAC